jgi:predicted transcriptional regulator YdeE
MQHETIKLPSRKFIGITVRTANTEQHKADIPAMWGRFFTEEIHEKIPNVIGNDFYGIYHEYASDHTDSYNFTAGCEVSSLDDIPKGMIGFTAPEQTYAVVNVEGDFPAELVKAWQNIWKSDLKRAYKCDLEHYGADFLTDKNAITIYLGITPSGS